MNFYEFPIPANLDGEQLKAELKCDEVYIRGNKLVIGTNGTLTLAQATDGITAHQTTFAAKKAEQEAAAANAATDKAALLAKLGITADEAKILLS